MLPPGVGKWQPMFNEFSNDLFSLGLLSFTPKDAAPKKPLKGHGIPRRRRLNTQTNFFYFLWQQMQQFRLYIIKCRHIIVCVYTYTYTYIYPFSYQVKH